MKISGAIFDTEGRLIVNQMDRKIDNGYYTFIDGQMQTGWINVAEAGFVSSSTPSNEAATADNSATDTVSLNDFRYYDPENGGRRASGWYTIEGAPGISEEEEPFSFFFKKRNRLLCREGSLLFSPSIPSATASTSAVKCNRASEPETGGWQLRLLLLRRRRRDAYRQADYLQ